MLRKAACCRLAMHFAVAMAALLSAAARAWVRKTEEVEQLPHNQVVVNCLQHAACFSCGEYHGHHAWWLDLQSHTYPPMYFLEGKQDAL